MSNNTNNKYNNSKPNCITSSIKASKRESQQTAQLPAYPSGTYNHPKEIEDYIAPVVVPVVMFSKEECERIVNATASFKLQSGKIESIKEGFKLNVDKNAARRARGVAIDKESQFFAWVYKRVVSVVVSLNAKYWKYPISDDYRSPLIEHIQYQTYHDTELGHYDWHQDVSARGTLATRRISITIQLSDESEYEGGDLLLKGSKDDTPMPKDHGYGIVFPSYMLHKVSPVTKGIRRSMAIWFQIPHPTTGFPPAVQPISKDQQQQQQQSTKRKEL